MSKILVWINLVNDCIHVAMGGSLGQIEAANPRLPGGSIGDWQVVGTYVKSPLYGP